MEKIVLVVDDDIGIQDLMQAILENEGYHVEVANDGVQALAALTRVRPILIILDYMMPNMDGRQFLAELQRLGDASTPIIMISANAALAETERSNVQAVIAKPFSISTLLNEVARWQVGHEGS